MAGFHFPQSPGFVDPETGKFIDTRPPHSEEDIRQLKLDLESYENQAKQLRLRLDTMETLISCAERKLQRAEYWYEAEKSCD